MNANRDSKGLSLGKCTRISSSMVVFDVKLGEMWKGKYEKVKDDALTDDTKCGFRGGALDGQVLTVGEIRARGLEVGRVPDRSQVREEGVVVCHARVFDNAPLLDGYGSPSWGSEDVPLWYGSVCERKIVREETSSIEQLEELAEDGDAAAMCKLAYWYVDKNLYRTIDLIAHSAMRLSPVAMTVIARLMLKLCHPGKNNRGKYWTWGIAIMAQASTQNSIAGQDLRVFTDELVGKIKRMKLGDNRYKYNAGLQKMCFAIEAFMERMRKNPVVVRSVMNQYLVDHKNVYHIPFVEFN